MDCVVPSVGCTALGPPFVPGDELQSELLPKRYRLLSRKGGSSCDVALDIRSVNACCKRKMPFKLRVFAPAVSFGNVTSSRRGQSRVVGSNKNRWSSAEPAMYSRAGQSGLAGFKEENLIGAERISSPREGQGLGFRTEGLTASEPRTWRKSDSNAAPSMGELEQAKSIEVERKPSLKSSEAEGPVFKNTLRHTFQTGTQRGGVPRTEDSLPRQGTLPNLGSNSNLDCEHFSRCSGCVIDTSLDHPLILRDTVSFFKKQGIDNFSWTGGSLWEWRCRAKLAVRGTSENPIVGLFEEASHIAVDIPSCRAHHPRINVAIELVKEAIRSLGIEPYIEDTGLGHLRYIQMVVCTQNTSLPAAERYANGNVQVTLVWNARDENSVQAKQLQEMTEFLWRRGGPRSPKPILHSIWVNFQTSRSNIIFGGKWRHLLGEQEMWERICGADICFTPASFGQANLQAFEALLRKLQTYVKRGSAVVELYAGVGVIGISLAVTRACRSVKCVEVNKDSKDSFLRSLSRVSDSLSCQISWHCADASVSPISWLEGADVIIVDPPRKGLDPSLIEALRIACLRSQGRLKSPSPYASTKVEKRPWVVRANRGVTAESLAVSDNDTEDEKEKSWPNTLIYVSCGWQSFKQDCAALIEDGAWHLDEGHGFNFFPGTDSVEVLAVFRSSRISGKKVNSGRKKKLGKKSVRKTASKRQVVFN